MFHNLKSHGTLDNSTLTLRVLNQNILYVTKQSDKILRILEDLKNMEKMQQKIEEFYDETSPQTDTAEQ